jgi:uncharacterized protein DUF6869
MTPRELDEFCEEYFRAWRVLRSGTRDERLALEHRVGPSELLVSLLDDESRLDWAWTITLALIERAPDDKALAFVGAGPLEDLIRRYPSSMADRIVTEARRNSRVRLALKAVWGLDRIPDQLASRLLELTSEPE